nr:PREDICTED: integrin alpha-E [Latimeria chalumnae]|eukprot:XP_006013122.1 PREDICTED: integrin alpha-E [Latimeria chalumnae]
MGTKIVRYKSVRSQKTINCIESDFLTPSNPADFEGPWNCTVAKCKVIECAFNGSEAEVNVTVDFKRSALNKLLEQSKDLVVTASLSINKDEIRAFTDMNGWTEREIKASVTILKQKVFNALPIVIGSSVGGFLLLALLIFLLYKCGFFKRGYKDKLEDTSSD